ncbi:MAG TPA: hypothetical protein VGL86_08875 [Polyangia bacterium]|jgi:hypothetical protein
MAKLLAIGAFFGLAIIFLVSELAHDKSKTPAVAAAAPTTPQPLPALRTSAPTGIATAAAPAAAASPVVAKLAPDSPVLRNRVEEQIPRQLYAEAARCYHGGLDKDKRLDLTYHLHVSAGEISVGELRTIENTLDDTALERCIHDRLLAKKWRDDALPDLDEDDDLYMRVGELQNNATTASAER